MLVEIQFGSTTRQLNYFKPRALLGRDKQDCELWVDDASVSRRHAEIWLDGEVVYLRDLGSANGTWIDGRPVGAQAVALAPGQAVHLGHAALGVAWPSRGPDARTDTAPPSPALLAAIAARHQAAPPAQPQYAYAPPQAQQHQQQQAPAQTQQAQAQQAQVQQARAQPAAIEHSPAAYQAAQAAARAGTGVAATLGVGGSAAPLPSELSYRRQGGNDNGTLLIALPGDTFSNASTLDGYLEFTATDSETVASILVELIELHEDGPRNGHVWDRCLVRQGPWKAQKGDVLPMPFRLRVPSGTSASGPKCHWQLRAFVDVEWARDIEATIPITMRNTDIETIRDALGMLDYRVAELEAEPLGQKHRGTFNPPMHLREQLNITDINLDIEYQGSNLEIVMEVEKSKLFARDKAQKFVFALDRLRAASVHELSQHWQAEIDKLMS